MWFLKILHVEVWAGVELRLSCPHLKVCMWPECEAMMIWVFDLEMNMKMVKWLRMNLAWMVLDGLTNLKVYIYLVRLGLR